MYTHRTDREQRLQGQRRQLSQGIGAGGEILKGSLIERTTVCQRPGCRCLKGQKHGPFLYASVFDGKQSRQVYVPQSMHAQVRRWVRNAQRLSEAVGTLSNLSVELIRRRQPQGAVTSGNRRVERQGAR
jgi:hypothetical protein